MTLLILSFTDLHINSKPALCLSSQTFRSLLTTSCFEFLNESIDNHINSILINLYNLNNYNTETISKYYAIQLIR